MRSSPLLLRTVLSVVTVAVGPASGCVTFAEFEPGQLVDAEDVAAEAGDGGEAAAIAYVHEDCGTCVAAACNAEEAACTGDDDCRSLYGCLAGCGRFGSACRHTCESMHPEVAAGELARALDTCRRGVCINECYGVGSLVLDLEGDVCSDCIDVACDVQTFACLRSEIFDQEGTLGDCERRWWCAQSLEPINPAGVLTCNGGYLHPGSEDMWFHYCRDLGCGVYCDTGRRWGCVDNYT